MARLTDEERERWRAEITERRRWAEVVTRATLRRHLLAALDLCDVLLDRLDSEPPPEGDDLAAVRAEGRRRTIEQALYEAEAAGLLRSAGRIEVARRIYDALLADPPDSLPEGEVVLDGKRYRVLTYCDNCSTHLGEMRVIECDECGCPMFDCLVPVTEGGDRDG